MKFITGLSILCICVFVSSSHASVITYTDRSTWETAVGSIAYTEDFESYVSDTSFHNTTIDVGNFTLSSVNSPSDYSNKIDVNPFIYTDGPINHGNAYAEMFVEDDATVTMTFDTGITSWFADFYAAGNSQLLSLQLSSGDVISVPGIGDSTQSFGFISTNSINSIIFTNTVNDGFSVDNIAVGTIPEPATMLLFGFGLLGIAGTSRRKK